MRSKYFFCYNKDVAMRLRFDKGIYYITGALHDKTGCKFWLFERTEQLDKALAEISS